MTKPKFPVELFDKASHDREAFSCGVSGMDRWFKDSITDQIKANRLRVWCAVDAEGRVVGFYGLSAHSVEAEAAPALSRRRERHPIPAVYLAARATKIPCRSLHVSLTKNRQGSLFTWANSQ